MLITLHPELLDCAPEHLSQHLVDHDAVDTAVIIMAQAHDALSSS